ncbi:MAG: TIGR03435 family protein, partial [Acidobacteriota bacterium]
SGEGWGDPAVGGILCFSNPKSFNHSMVEQACSARPVGRPCRMGGLGPGQGLSMDVKSCDFSWFVKMLSLYPELRSRVLVDKTGLHGRYSFKFHFTPHVYRIPGTPEPSGPSLATALHEQLGLKVVSGKAPEDVLAIEHIERPTPN